MRWRLIVVAISGLETFRKAMTTWILVETRYLGKNSFVYQQF